MLDPNEAAVFLKTFVTYNATVFPYTVLTYAMAILAVILVIKKSRNSSAIVFGILAVLWAFAGVVLLIVYLGPIKPLWYLSGGMWVVQSLLFIKYGVFKQDVTFKATKDGYSIYGFLLILYAAVIYTVIGALTGHDFPHGPMFGSACCPITIFTFGVLLTADRKVPIYLMIIPFIWAVGGIMAVVQYEVFQDLGLFISGITAVPLIIYKNKGLDKQIA